MFAILEYVSIEQLQQISPMRQEEEALLLANSLINYKCFLNFFSKLKKIYEKLLLFSLLPLTTKKSLNSENDFLSFKVEQNMKKNEEQVEII